jgi:phage tail sheath gpL-like
VWFRNTSPGAVTVGEIAAAYAATLAGNITPFVPVNNYVLGGVTAPALADRISTGAGLESETALGKGWTPLKTKPNEEVIVVRSVTSRITTDGTVAASAYFDVQDFQVLYYWRKTIFARLNQPDLKNVKASDDTAKIIKSELIRLAGVFEDNSMFQRVTELSKLFTVVRSTSDRHRFDVSTPVNVIPGLHVVATTVRAGTWYDDVSV